MAATEASTSTFVLGLEPIRWGISQLQAAPIHSFFIAYLEVRRQAVTQDTDTVQPNWARFDDYLEVPGGPPGKPYFRPFWDQARNAGQDWMNRHPAGSYNPNSIRPGTPGARVLGSGGKYFKFGEDHWQLAREHLLHDQRAPLIPLCLFLYRNYGFHSSGPSAPHPSGLIELFRSDFAYRDPSHNEEFAYVFDPAIPDRNDWFEPLPPSATEVDES